MSTKAWSPNTCIKCKRGALLPHHDEMDRANGLRTERKCNQCGKEFPAYPFEYKLTGLHGKRPDYVDQYLESLIREMIPIHGQYTVQRIMGVLGLTRSLIYDIYARIRKDIGVYYVIDNAKPQEVAQVPDVLTWAKTETYTQPWGIQELNGRMPQFEEVVKIEWTGKVISQEIRQKS